MIKTTISRLINDLLASAMVKGTIYDKKTMAKILNAIVGDDSNFKAMSSLSVESFSLSVKSLV